MTNANNNFSPLLPKHRLPASRRAQKIPKERLFTREYFLGVISFVMLLLNSTYGTIAIIGFLFPWSIFFIQRPSRILSICGQNWVLFLMPALALASCLWSRDPKWTFNAATELAVTVVVGVMAASLIKPRILIAALFSAHLIIALLCILAAAKSGMSGLGGGSAMQGIFSSKNAFSAVMCLLLLLSISVYLDKTQNGLMRVAALGSIFLAPALLYLGQSVGAIVSVLFTAVAFLPVRVLGRFDPAKRRVLLFVVLIAAGLVTITVLFAQLDASFLLKSVGKDPTLTGRVFLWNHAEENIASRPLLGLGYSAFWRIDNNEARELWFRSAVPMGAGFNFHNEYLEMLVELGIVGLCLMLTYFVVLSVRAVRAVLTIMSAEQNFAFMVLVLSLLRSPVEVGLFTQFNTGVILICVTWIYFRPMKKQARKTQQLPITSNRPQSVVATKSRI